MAPDQIRSTVVYSIMSIMVGRKKRNRLVYGSDVEKLDGQGTIDEPNRHDTVVLVNKKTIQRKKSPACGLS